MGSLRKAKPVVFFVAVSSGEQSAIDWARDELGKVRGPLLVASAPFDFNQTSYYQKEMGTDLIKQFFAFENLIDPAEIVSEKLRANELEQRYFDEHPSNVTRPVNIDPGYVTEAKLVLATTKDRDHRIYLDRGILAEITLFFQGEKWNPSRWTYPDYNTNLCFEFLNECRDYLRTQIHSGNSAT